MKLMVNGIWKMDENENEASGEAVKWRSVVHGLTTNTLLIPKFQTTNATNYVH